MTDRARQKRREKKLAERRQRSTASSPRPSRFSKIRKFLASHGLDIAGNPGAEELKIILLGLLTEGAEVDAYDVLDLMEESFSGHPETLIARGIIFGDEGMLAHAHEAYSDFLANWPVHPLAHDAKKILERLTSDLEEGGVTNLELALDRELVEMAISSGQLEEAQSLAMATLEKWPGDDGVLNSLVLLHMVEGRLEEALLVNRRRLEADPNNLLAKVTEIRLLLMTGQKDKAALVGQTLPAEMSRPNDDLKLAEGFALLNRFESVLQVHERVRQRDPDCTVIDHFAAVAHSRQGRWPEARQLWERALDDEFDGQLAEENLENSQLPQSERWPAWIYPLEAWLTMEQVEFLAESGDDPNTILSKRPELRAALTNNLELGCPLATKLTLQLLLQQPTGASAELLSGFARGRWGTEQLRTLAAAAVESGQPYELEVEG